MSIREICKMALADLIDPEEPIILDQSTFIDQIVNLVESDLADEFPEVPNHEMITAEATLLLRELRDLIR